MAIYDILVKLQKGEVTAYTHTYDPSGFLKYLELCSGVRWCAPVHNGNIHNQDGRLRTDLNPDVKEMYIGLSDRGLIEFESNGECYKAISEGAYENAVKMTDGDFAYLCAQLFPNVEKGKEIKVSKDEFLREYAYLLLSLKSVGILYIREEYRKLIQGKKVKNGVSQLVWDTVVKRKKGEN